MMTHLIKIVLINVCLLGVLSAVVAAETKTETATFAGGCFWCMTPPFEKLKGVTEVISGYTGGEGKDPTYEDYAKKGHVEVVEIKYDPSVITYSQLLDVFWRQINPTDGGGQFVDLRTPVSIGDLLPQRRTKGLSRKSKGSLGKIREVSQTAGHRDYPRDHLLQSRGLSPGLLQEEPDQIRMVSVSIRSGSIPGKSLGKGQGCRANEAKH